MIYKISLYKMSDIPNLNNLPMEIKQQIMNNLSVSDVNNLRLTSLSLSNPSLFKAYIDKNLKSV